MVSSATIGAALWSHGAGNLPDHSGLLVVASNATNTASGSVSPAATNTRPPAIAGGVLAAPSARSQTTSPVAADSTRIAVSVPRSQLATTRPPSAAGRSTTEPAYE